MRRRNSSRPTVRKVLPGARSKALDRTSSTAFAASSRRAAPTGKRFFAEGTPARAVELVNTQAFPSGIIFTTYKVAGPLETG